MVEGARLESEYAPKAYPGFESLPLRQPVGEPALLARPPALVESGWDDADAAQLTLSPDRFRAVDGLLIALGLTRDADATPQSPLPRLAVHRLRRAAADILRQRVSRMSGVTHGRWSSCVAFVCVPIFQHLTPTIKS